MKKKDFLVDLEEVLQREDSCKENDILDEYEEWDSLAKMALIAYYSKNFNLELTLGSFKDLKTANDLIELAEGKILD